VRFRVGAGSYRTSTIRLDVRLVAATNPDLGEFLEDRELARDLYER
jgi:transcriptional regulator with GAF, ATPase, and Fis domain